MRPLYCPTMDSDWLFEIDISAGPSFGYPAHVGVIPLPFTCRI